MYQALCQEWRGTVSTTTCNAFVQVKGIRKNDTKTPPLTSKKKGLLPPGWNGGLSRGSWAQCQAPVAQHVSTLVTGLHPQPCCEEGRTSKLQPLTPG